MEKLKEWWNVLWLGTFQGVRILYIVLVAIGLVFGLWWFMGRKKKRRPKRRRYSVARSRATARSNRRSPSLKQKRLNALAKARRVRAANLRKKRRAK